MTKSPKVRAGLMLLPALLLGSLSSTGHASITFFDNQGDFSSFTGGLGIDTENVVFNRPEAVLGPAEVVTGVGTDTGVLVDISSEAGELLEAQAMGAAEVGASDDAFSTVMFVLQDMDPMVALGFAALFNDPDSDDTVTLMVEGTNADGSVISGDDATGTFTLGPGMGNRFFGAVAEDGQQFTKLTFSTDSAEGFEAIRQIELTAGVPPDEGVPVIPEPSSTVAWALLAGLAMTTVVLRRRNG